MDFRFEKAGELGFLIFDGDLTEENASNLKEALLVSLDNADHLVINFENVTKIDRFCLRLFCKACKKSEKLGKRLTFTGISHEMCKRVEEFVGYNIRLNHLIGEDSSSIFPRGVDA
jgi:anti-anti-sigma factor